MKMIKSVLLAVLLTCVMVGTASAAFVTASVGTASSTDGNVSLKLTFVSTSGIHEPVCTEFVDSWFTPMTGNMDDHVLAMALTAISLDRYVRVTVTTCPPTISEPGVFSSIGIIVTE